MRHLTVIAFILLVVCHSEMVSQSCLPDGITFTSQSQIDSFPINYPGCTEIEGDVYIGFFSFNDEINNLYGLGMISSIGGDLYITANDSLTSLVGLEGLISVGGDLKIMLNHSLNSISGMVGLIDIAESLYIWDNNTLTSLEFEGLTSIGKHLVIGGNGSIPTLIGLESVTFIGGGLGITSNFNLYSLSGLDGVNSIGEGLVITDNNSLSDLSGLVGVVSIGGYLTIANNEALSSLEGLENIDSGTIEDLYIHSNNSLSTCEVESVCNYLKNPNGSADIYDNAQGCNSIEEVEVACETIGTYEQQTVVWLSTYPNPFTASTTIEYELFKRSNIQYTVYNSIGEVVYQHEDRNMPPGRHKVTWSPGHLPAGLYYAVLRSGDGVSVVKLIKQ